MRSTLIILLLLQVTAPIPRPTEPAANSAREGQQATNPSKENAVPSAPVKKAENPATDAGNRSEVAGENKQIRAVVDSLPKKDQWDIAYDIATLLLVLIGAGTLCAILYQSVQTKRAADAARDTVTEIQKQVTIMERQTKAIEDNATAAREGAEASKRSIDMMMAKERARVLIRPDKLNLDSGSLPVHSVDYTIFCYGAMYAEISNSWVAVQVTDSSEAPPETTLRPPMSIGPVLLPNPEGVKKTTLIFDKPGGDIIGPINERKLFVYFSGSVKYTDVFGREHENRFEHVWNVSHLKNMDGSVFAYWVKSSRPGNNYET